MSRERADREDRTNNHGEEDVLAVFNAVSGPVVTSADVAQALTITDEIARWKLDRLVERDVLKKRETAHQSVYWRSIDDDGNSDHRKSNESVLPDPFETEAAALRAAGSDRPVALIARWLLIEEFDYSEAELESIFGPR
jgi:hypothetical protein